MTKDLKIPGVSSSFCFSVVPRLVSGSERQMPAKMMTAIPVYMN